MQQESLRITIAKYGMKLDYIAENLDKLNANMETHIINDANDFKEMRREISALNKYGGAIAVVASGFTLGAQWIWQKLTNRV